MSYNISPILKVLNDDVPNAPIWRERLTQFFANTEYDADLQDWYYDTLLANIEEATRLFYNGNFVDHYTGLFSMPSYHIEGGHSFNFAYFISKHYQHFYNKRILTVCADYGILNIQAKLCGLNIISSVQRPYYNVGTILACIGNNCPPYSINKLEFEEEDVIMMSCVFQEDALTYTNWEFMLDKRIAGKEVFFTSNTFFYLRRYMNYDKIELVMDPQKVYNSEDYADISYGYMNRIYRLK